ncbi:MAG: HD-GYP domain-containing protein [Phycisphaerales bacterium]
MLLCGVGDVEPGMVLGASVVRPDAPDAELLKAGVALDQPLLARLRSMGITQIWVQDDLTKDLDNAVSPEVAAAKAEVFRQLKDDLGAASRRAVTAADISNYRQAVLGMVCKLIGDARYASLTDSLFTARDLAAHGTNVAYLSVLAGLDLEAYLVKEQPRLPASHARDGAILGLAGMLHDLGKARQRPALSAHHEAQHPDGAAPPEEYTDHTTIGFQMLRDSRASPRATQAVLNHHQRFDGRGWPDMAKITHGRRNGPLAGRHIHIFTRIVSAANVLDNLLRTADGQRLPPVAALHQFASSRFDGWFDPLVRRAMLRRIPPFAIGSDVRLTDGRRAVVIGWNAAEPCRPTVRVLSPAGNPPVAIDLGTQPGLFIAFCQGVDVGNWNYQIPSILDCDFEPAPQPIAPAGPPRSAAASLYAYPSLSRSSSSSPKWWPISCSSVIRTSS